jgi:predicted amidohydrolase YtcJ
VATGERILYRGGLVMTDAGAEPAAIDILVGDGVILDLRPDIDPGDAAHVYGIRGVVLPAFVDAHAHVTETGLFMQGIDLGFFSSSLSSILGEVGARARSFPGAPILGHGWDELKIAERRPPTADELEYTAPGHEVYLSRVDVHSAVVSATLADRAGLRDLPGWDDSGRVEREAHHAAREWTRARIPPRRREALQRLALRDAAKRGIGFLHEMSAPHVATEEDLATLVAIEGRRSARGEDQVLPRVVPYRGTLVQDAAEARDVAKRLRDRGVALAGLAGDLVADGAVGSRTACFHEPYADAPGHSPDHRGHRYLDADQVGAHVAACTEVGLQAGFHVIGDAAVAEVLEGFALAAAQVGADAVRAARHRLEHVEAVGPRDIARLAALGLTASVQPAFDAAWGGATGMYATRLGVERAAGLNPFAAFLAGGVPLAFGSDSPVTPFDPWGAIRACVLHQEPRHRIGLAAALHAHTAGGHHAAGREGGVLAVGAEATFAVWQDENFKARLPDFLAEEERPQLDLMVIGGRIVG